MNNKQRAEAVPTVQVDNNRVKVTEWAFAPGAETGWHRHEMDYVVVPQTTGELLIESSSAQARSSLTIGQAYYRDAGVEHNVINDNDFDFVFVEVEVKPS